MSDRFDRRDAAAPWGYDDLLRALGETLTHHYREERIAA